MIAKIIITSVLLSFTVVGVGGAFYGWFVPKAMKQPVSMRDGSGRNTSHFWYMGSGRTHTGGGPLGGK
jgi:hypothetical protein